ncbi:unnamed protein product [Fusarium fujikuroi]|nr:uncharacterized protein Y057_1224 [Fusarium fujikuroi]VTT61499.1 unnamed protein product [Fusarium fujikuroi]
MTSSASMLRCDFCSETFKRKEPLERHARRHSGAKPFKCKSCSKAFSRKDVLMRHSNMHASDPSETSTTRGRPRKAPARKACSSSKLRCSQHTSCGSPKANSAASAHLSNSQDGGGINSPSDGPETQAISSIDITLSDQQLSSLEPTQPSADQGDFFSTSGIEALQSGLQEVLATEAFPVPESNTSIPLLSHDLTLSTGSEICSDSTNRTGTEQSHTSPSWVSSLLFPDDNAYSWRLDETGPISILDLLGPSTALNIEDMGGQPQGFEGQTFSITKTTDISSWGQGADNGKSCLPAQMTNGYDFMPHPLPEDDHAISAEDFGHVNQINKNSYDKIVKFSKQKQQSEGGPFPDFKRFHIFIQLYYEYFDGQFPCIHPSTLNRGNEAWILLLAVAAVGSQYSSMSHADQYAARLQELLNLAVTADRPELKRKPSLPFVQSTLLSHVFELFSGSRDMMIKGQLERRSLNTLCQLLARSPYEAQVAPNSDDEQSWEDWVVGESLIRLVYCVYKLECFQLILMNLDPMFQPHHMVDRFPCTENPWSCRDVDSWQVFSGIYQVKGPSLLADLSNGQLGTFAREMHILTFYAEERSIHDRFSSPFWKSFMEASPIHLPRGSAMTMDSQSMVKSVLVGSTGFINKSLETLSAVHSSQPDFDGHYTSVMCYHILLILRHVSLRMLYAFSGWQATQDQIDEAKEYLRAWMRENPSAARRCLWHAVRAFRILRNKQHFACDDSFSLLLAALFMWAFDLLMPSSSYGAVSQEDSQTVHKRPTRIDLLRDADEVKSWVEEGSHRTHITGIEYFCPQLRGRG